jgi:hypothetical protein
MNPPGKKSGTKEIGTLYIAAAPLQVKMRWLAGARASAGRRCGLFRSNYVADPGLPSPDALLDRYVTLTGWSGAGRALHGAVDAFLFAARDFEAERRKLAQHLTVGSR